MNRLLCYILHSHKVGFFSKCKEEFLFFFHRVERALKITTKQTVEMKEKNIIAPFIFKKVMSKSA